MYYYKGQMDRIEKRKGKPKTAPKPKKRTIARVSNVSTQPAAKKQKTIFIPPSNVIVQEKKSPAYNLPPTFPDFEWKQENLLFRQTFPKARLASDEQDKVQQLAMMDAVELELLLILQSFEGKSQLTIDVKDFFRQFRGIPDYKVTFSRMHPAIKQALSGCKTKLSKEFFQFFTREGISVIKPYLTPDLIQRYNAMKGDYIYDLIPGDVIHYAFSPAEMDIINKCMPVTKNNITIVASKLPGRTERDIIRFLHHRDTAPPEKPLKQNPFIIREPICNPIQKKRKSTTTHKMLQLKEYGSKASKIWNNKRSVHYNMLSKLTKMRISNKPSDGIVDVKLNRTCTKLLCGTARKDAERDNISLLYDLEKGTVRVLKEHMDTVSRSLFSNDDKHIVTSSYDGTIIVRPVDTCIPETIIRMENNGGLANKILDIRLHPRENDLIASMTEKEIHLWKFGQETPVRTVVPPQEGTLIDLEFAGAGDFEHILVCAEMYQDTGQGCVHLYNVNKTQMLYHILENTMVNAIGVDNEHRYMYATKDVVKMYDMRQLSKKPIKKFRTGQTDTNSISFSPCQRFVQISGTNNCCVICDVRFGRRPLYYLQHTPVPVTANTGIIGITGANWYTSSFIVTGGEDKNVRVWDLSRANPQIAKYEGSAHISALDVSRHGDMIVAGDEATSVFLWTLEDDVRYLLQDNNSVIEAGGVMQVEEPQDMENVEVDIEVLNRALRERRAQMADYQAAAINGANNNQIPIQPVDAPVLIEPMDLDMVNDDEDEDSGPELEMNFSDGSGDEAHMGDIVVKAVSSTSNVVVANVVDDDDTAIVPNDAAKSDSEHRLLFDSSDSEVCIVLTES